MFVSPNHKTGMCDSDVIRKLIGKIAADDSDAFTRFYDLFYAKVYRFSGYFLKSDILCQEVVSDVFLGIWQSRKKLVHVENIESYLYTSTRNKAFSYLKDIKKISRASLGELPIGIISDDRTPEEIIVTKELKKVIDDSIEALPDRCRLIFLMAREEGLKYREIAKILSLSEKTINAQMVTAIRKLGTALQKFFSA